jgi:predicted O-linked N-acetylglucosamine transferase (SPINDLY family)
MGVPVVTLPGRTIVSRAGQSILYNLDLAELVADTQEEFVRIACELAQDRKRLSEMRNGLPERMQRSVLMDAKSFTRQIEEHYRGVCRSR